MCTQVGGSRARGIDFEEEARILIFLTLLDLLGLFCVIVALNCSPNNVGSLLVYSFFFDGKSA